MHIEYESNEKLFFDYEALINRVAEEALLYEKCPYETEVNVILTDNEEIRSMNNQFRSVDKPTDVLSFPMVDYISPSDFSRVEGREEEYFDLETGELMLGDIIISVEKAREQAMLYGHSEEREIGFLTAHSMLHLLGYDHMEEDERVVMEKKQEAILKAAGLERV